MEWVEQYKEVFGDSIKMIKEDTARLMFIMLAGYPFSTKIKNREVQALVRDHKVDILGMAETDINWSRIPFVISLMREDCHAGNADT